MHPDEPLALVVQVQGAGEKGVEDARRRLGPGGKAGKLAAHGGGDLGLSSSNQHVALSAVAALSSTMIARSAADCRCLASSWAVCPLAELRLQECGDSDRDRR